MKQLILNIKDDSKFDILMKFLREINFVEVQNEDVDKDLKVWGELPESMLNPIKVDNFKMFGRDELYER
ncbi:MAG: hypothetical protein PVH64_00950 [Bacillota bacterium]|jgi:hypothetical protein